MTLVLTRFKARSLNFAKESTPQFKRIRVVVRAASPPDQTSEKVTPILSDTQHIHYWTLQPRKPSPLESGGTLTDEKALGKDAASSTLKKSKGEIDLPVLQIADGQFSDYRWVDGRWNFGEFKDSKGDTDWDEVIDAEIARRKLLEDAPIASIRDAVKFDTSEIPWWAWVKRFHLPVAEKLNGRAAMVGYALAIVGEQLSGAGLLEQQNSFFGKLLLHIAVFAILLIQEVRDVYKYRNLIEEAFFYDQQWAASWVGKQRPSESSDT